MELLYLPLTLYIIFIASIRTGKLFFFAAANPEVPLGGFAGDSKFKILLNVPDKLKPKTIKISKQENDFSFVENAVVNKGIEFPVVAKPDIGEAGFLVRKIYSFEELEKYHFSYKMDYLIQEFIDGPLEISVLMHNAKNGGEISSITERRYLEITGDGISTVGQLLLKDPATSFRTRKLKKLLQPVWNTVPAKDEVLQPLHIGNWNYGAQFIDVSEKINPALTAVFTNVTNQVGLFNYCRYDVKCKNFDELQKGNFKILEINGVKGEPIHIYDKRKKLFGAYKEIFRHWEMIVQISERNIKNGYACPCWKKGINTLLLHNRTKTEALTPRK